MMSPFRLMPSVAVCLLSAAATATPYGLNLITNPGAELGAGSSDGSTVSVPGWTITGDFTAVQYGASGGFPAASDPGPADRGSNFFAGGPANGSSSASQTIDVSDLAASIDAGLVGFHLSGWLGGWLAQDDGAVVTLSFLSSAGSPVSIGPVLAVDRGSLTGLLFREISGAVPSLTRSLEIEIAMTRQGGSYNDGYADNLSLILRESSRVSDVGGTAWLFVLGVAGLRAARLRRD